MSERYDFVEVPTDAVDEKRWNWLLFRLEKKFPHHYYIDESIGVKIKRASKKKIMNYILSISQEVLTTRQHLYFRLYYDSFPRLSIRELALYFGKSYEAVFKTLRRAKYRLLKFLSKNTRSKKVKENIELELNRLDNIKGW